MDLLSSELLPARARAVAIVQTLIPGGVGKVASDWAVEVFQRPFQPRRSRHIQSHAGVAAQNRMGGLCKRTLRRTKICVGLSVAIYAQGAISNTRLIRADADSVTFRVKDYRIDGPGRHKTMTLATDEFIRRFLIHVLPRGQHRIRHYGFFGNGNRAANIACIRGLLAVAPSSQSGKKTTEVDDDQSRVLALPCPACAGRMIIIESFAPECQPRAPPGRKAAA